MKQELYMRIRLAIRDIIKDTEWQGHVFCVGGCVRDELMGNEIKDIDLVVDLPGGGIHFAEWLYENNHLQGKIVAYPNYGTSMFHLKAFPYEELEAVQTRKEKYPDAKTRNPETAYGTIEEDCLRRDLTINALYINVSTEDLIDITGYGVEDIKNHTIRTTTEPDIIYDDDPLRILRCIRFATRYGWKIEQSTYDGMKSNVHRLAIITKERVRDELNKMLVCKYPVQALELLRSTGAMHYVMPEMEKTYNMTQNEYHFGTVWEHTLKVVESLTSNDLLMRMSALLHDIGKIQTREETAEGKVHFIMHDVASKKMAEDILHRLKYSTEFIRQVQFLVGHHMRTKAWKDDLECMKPKHLRKLQHICETQARFNQLMLLIDADNHAHAEGYCLLNQVDGIKRETAKMVEEGCDMFEYKLPFSGKDIMEIKHISQGPAVKECLEHLLKLAYVNPLRTREEWAKHIIGFQAKADV